MQQKHWRPFLMERNGSLLVLHRKLHFAQAPLGLRYNSQNL